MAKQTKIVLVDDLDGSVAETTVSFTLDGVSYEIDLSNANAARLRSDFGRWVEKARRTGGRKVTGRKAGSGEDVAAIRAWAVENGYEVNTRGRIPAKIREAYVAAH